MTLIFTTLLASWSVSAQDIDTNAIVIEAVHPRSAEHHSGLRAGDVLTSWDRAASPPANPAPAQGGLRTPFDLTEVEIEQAPRGPVTLRGVRGGQPLAVLVAPGAWQVKSRPVMARRTLEQYTAARALAIAGQEDAATSAWRAAADAAGGDTVAAWLWLQAGQVLRDAKKMPAAHTALDEALALARRARDRAAIAGVQEAKARVYDAQGEAAAAEREYRAVIAARQGDGVPGLGTARGLVNLASIATTRGDTGAAEPLLREALAIQRQLAPDSVVLAKTLGTLGRLVQNRGDLDAAAPMFRAAVDLLERLAPGTADLAESLNNLGGLFDRRQAIDEAAPLYERALRIYERVDPAGSGMARTLASLGLITYFRGRLAEAEPFYRRALSLWTPGTMDEARSLNNLGILLVARGDLMGAEEFYLRSLVIKERLSPGSLSVASTLHNLAVLYKARGDTARAEDFYTRSLDLTERAAPGSLDVATTLGNLGNLARARGDLDAAERLHQQALTIKQQKAPGSIGVAQTLDSLGGVAEARGDLPLARERYGASRRLSEQVAPHGLEMPVTLLNLARLANRQGEPAEAGRLLARALAITEAQGAESMRHADALRANGLQARRHGDLDGAVALLARAIDTVESQTVRVGGSDDGLNAFAGKGHEFFVDYIDTLLMIGRPAMAFEVLERSRARGLRAMLAKRDLVLDADLPPELARARQGLREDDDQVQDALARLQPGRDDVEIARLQARRRDLRARRARIIDQVRAASPRLAALQYAPALGLATVRQSLDAGTVLLSYHIGASASRLFVVNGGRTAQGSLTVHDVAVGTEQLRDQVVALRRHIERQDDPRQPSGAGFLAAARQLYDVLLAPAAGAIAAADRILIVPDGPLHNLPFGALVRLSAASPGRAWQYVAEWKPLHTTLSATVYADLTRARSTSPGPSTLVAFGDPEYPATTARAEGLANVGVNAMLRRGYAFDALPATRAEVTALARSFGEAATVHLGADATESRAKAIRTARYVHFATHGLLDARSPLDSALALAVPATRRDGEENGLLQAWEIFEQVRLDADLVTLSACETALGAELAGEGLIGLTRAFHYAGARSVLASLWRVADDSTAALMARVYARLQAGMPKDEALRRAQLDAIAQPATAAPFHWAAFTLSGDWR